MHVCALCIPVHTCAQLCTEHMWVDVHTACLTHTGVHVHVVGNPRAPSLPESGDPGEFWVKELASFTRTSMLATDVLQGQAREAGEEAVEPQWGQRRWHRVGVGSAHRGWIPKADPLDVLAAWAQACGALACITAGWTWLQLSWGKAGTRGGPSTGVGEVKVHEGCTLFIFLFKFYYYYF